MNLLTKYGLALCVACTVATAEIVELTVLQTADLHSTIQLSRTENPRGDMLRAATVIRRQRQAAGGHERSLLIDCGDTIQGSFIAAVSRGEAAITYLNAMQYDAWIPGNHELDFGVARLQELIQQCRVPIIAGNFSLPGQSFPGYLLIQKGSARIALMGMNASALDHWLWGRQAAGFTAGSATVAIESVLPEIMALQPDLIIVALHQGFQEQERRGINEVADIAARFPQIDLILGAHTHRSFAGKRLGGAWYVQPGGEAQQVAEIRAMIDTDRHEVIEIRSRLIAPREFAPDPETRVALQPWIEVADQVAAKTIVFLDGGVSAFGQPGYDCHISEVFCRALAWRTGASVVFHGVLSDVSWVQGDLTEATLYDTVPYENEIGVATLTLAELWAIVEEQFQWQDSRSFNGIFGMNVVMDGETRRVEEICWPDGAVADPSARISVAFNSYVIAGGGRRFPVLRTIVRTPEAALRSTGLTTREVLRDYLRETEGWRVPPLPWFEFR